MTPKNTPRTRTSRDPSASPESPRTPRPGRSQQRPGYAPAATPSPARAATPPPARAATPPPPPRATMPPPEAPAVATNGALTLPISAALRRQLESQAQEDGVSLGQLATELLAEGLVRRAWDLPGGRPESRPATSGQRTAPPGGRGPDRGRRPQHNRQDAPRGDRQRAPRPAAANMDDQATFLAYVRQQERQRR